VQSLWWTGYEKDEVDVVSKSSLRTGFERSPCTNLLFPALGLRVMRFGTCKRDEVDAA
jgi:hypothetical protein